MTHPLYKVLFLCTGNSCRSQRAEGDARALGQGVVEVDSAGIEAHGKNPRAMTVMAEDGVDISGQESTRLTAERLTWAQRVVTVCGHADAHGPVLPPGTRQEPGPLDDPAKATETEDEIRAPCRHTRDESKQRVGELIQHLRTAVTA